MSKAVNDPERCRPDLCPGGICAARTVCSVRAVYQEEPFDLPIFDWGRCRACSKCLAVCPAGAIYLAR